MDSVVVDMLKYHTISLRFFNVFDDDDDVDAEADDDDEDNNNDQVTQARGSNFLAIRMRLR